MDGTERMRGARGRFCVCIECDTRVPHQDWITCYERRCPMCGSAMVMEGSPYHVHLMRHGRDSLGRSPSTHRAWRWRHRQVHESYG